jgi:hypothetical protein
MMQNRVPIVREARSVPLDFTPVPRKFRHDGWTPERQKAFIEALADTGSVSRAAAMVNMAQANCYTLRRAPGAESFRRAWEAALDFGVQRLKDIAFDRAIDGHLVPVFVAGKLMGFRRKHNDALLMFCLRHYGQDANGKRTTVNYFSSRATAGVVAGVVAGAGSEANGSVANGGVASAAEASTTTVRTVINGDGGNKIERDDGSAQLINGFDGVDLDPQAHADIQAALEACAARVRDKDPDRDAPREQILAGELADPEVDFVRVPEDSAAAWHGLENGMITEDGAPFIPGENDWRSAGAEVPDMYHEVFDQLQRKHPPRALASPLLQIAEVKPRPSRARRAAAKARRRAG